MSRKLRAILLLEADYKFSNKQYFGYRLMQISKDPGILPK